MNETEKHDPAFCISVLVVLFFGVVGMLCGALAFDCGFKVTGAVSFLIGAWLFLSAVLARDRKP